MANLIFKVEYEFNKSLPTAATDGYTTWYNPEFMDMLSEDSQIVVVAHEVAHAALLHAQSMRKLPKNKIDKGNIAADFLVNSLVKELGLIDTRVEAELTDACGVFFLNDKYNCVDYSFEKLMKELPDSQKECAKLGKSSGKEPKVKGDGFSDIVISDKTKESKATSAEQEARAQEMKEAFVQAINQHRKEMKKQGKGMGFLDRFLDNLLAPKIDWRRELFDFFKRTVKDETSWKRPNRRFLPSGYYLPIRSGVGAGVVGVAVDLSGSISQKELNIFFSELQYIFEVCRPEKIVLVSFDDSVRQIFELEEWDQKIKLVGGGGTNFIPVFSEFEKWPIEALVFMTDMYGPFPKEAPEYPVLFVSTSDVDKAPFGRVVSYDKT